ncbi:hypothetical protein SCT_2618 [Sulfuricella sp. T08]|uniref:ATP-binding protein n=1 Tax=Sulfuricella sp. T08 TaxID=1632857 RepID=UPI0006179758|nr:ATP-binding protein [Sulfuricella sp. T08]GAO37200.1 hypothetical protein SCT_2618 [Sulfuricella sp. T08]
MTVRRRASLAKSTGLLFVVLAIAIQFITLLTTSTLILYPIARNSVNDLAALIVLSSKTWGELPPSRLSDFQIELQRHHALDVEISTAPLSGSPSYLPYVALLQTALADRLKAPVSVLVIPGTDRYGVVVPAGAKQLRFEFSRARIGTSPMLAMSLVFGINLAASFAAALWLTRRLERRLSALSAATRELAQGVRPKMLPEDGPTELATVAADFNHMASRVRELADNRTTLLAGISHDLRTPIARMTMALELLRDSPNPALLKRMERYLAEMNQLIDEFLSFARAQENGATEPIDLAQMISELIRDYRESGAQLSGEPATACPVQANPVGVRRIVTNLIDNAIRYSGGGPVEIKLDCTTQAYIEVLDRGPGIPDDMKELVFRPFFRLESSRNATTGGSGLGLAIAMEIVRAHGWSLTLENRQGGGTVSRLTIPRKGRRS